MKYDFKNRIDRKASGSIKWELMYKWNPDVDEGVLPLSVADMELLNPPEIYEGLTSYIQSNPVLGYTGPTDEFLDAVVNWQGKRHQWTISKEWIVNTTGVVSAFNAAIRAFSNPGDGVIIFKPVYYPFSSAITSNNRKEVNVPLIETDGYYTIDFEGLEDAASKEENKILLFCSPHNPVGRVWTKEELEKLAEIALKYDLIVISDEIWYDFVNPGHKHTILHKVNKQLQDRLITCTAASKTFNLAGLATSSIIISNEKLRDRFVHEVNRSHYRAGNIFGFEATKIAYNECEKWLDKLLELVYSNQKMVNEFFSVKFPKIKAPISEGTYLQWLDFRELGMNNQELEEFLHKNQFFTDEGYIFGKEGNGFERINVALPQDALKELLERLLIELLAS
ncbi:MAG: pyridoxal phosphate-dependent aminotransferase [Clostridiales bacterium]|nr:pyridoxal phosphate-dependent aminotransferase [Clostridiales bacterium]